MSQIDIPFVAIHNKGLEIKNVTKSYNKKNKIIFSGKSKLILNKK